jgi:hypothetical protein
MIETVEDPHEGGFAGPILPQEGMNFAPAQGKIDPIIGEQGAKPFANTSHLNGGGRIIVLHRRFTFLQPL